VEVGVAEGGQGGGRLWGGPPPLWGGDLPLLGVGGGGVGLSLESLVWRVLQ
jgi:hypothetical protein